MTSVLSKIWRWFTLADAPTIPKPVYECLVCGSAATCHVSLKVGGQTIITHTCPDHINYPLRQHYDLSRQD